MSESSFLTNALPADTEAIISFAKRPAGRLKKEKDPRFGVEQISSTINYLVRDKRKVL